MLVCACVCVRRRVGLADILAMGHRCLTSSFPSQCLQGNCWVSSCFADTFGSGGRCQGRQRSRAAHLRGTQLSLGEEGRAWDLWALGRDAEVGEGQGRGAGQPGTRSRPLWPDE